MKKLSKAERHSSHHSQLHPAKIKFILQGIIIIIIIIIIIKRAQLQAESARAIFRGTIFNHASFCSTTSSPNGASLRLTRTRCITSISDVFASLLICSPVCFLGKWLQGLATRVQQRSFAEKAVAAEVDWDAISGLIHSDDGKRELVSLRMTFLDIQSRLASMSKETAAPNWAEWSKELDPKIVNGFKQAFESKSFF